MTAANDAVRSAEAAKRARWDFLRRYYAKHTPAILEAKPWQWAVGINAVDWCSMFSPIEYAFWCDMRMEGVILYPQYPIAGFFVDFAHPKFKVAVECDGAIWHQDRKKDYERDERLRALGWSVFRLTGSQCMQETDYDNDDNEQSVSRPVLLLRELGEQYAIGPRWATSNAECAQSAPRRIGEMLGKYAGAA